MQFTNEIYEKIRYDIINFGYSIVENILPEQVLSDLRDYGFSLLNEPVAESVVWDPYIGERNKLCYSDDSFQCMFRGYAFPWNIDGKQPGFEIFDELNLIRLNLASGISNNPVTKFNDIYTTWTYYPPGKGWLKKHQDSVCSNSILLHYIIPLTFKGSDFDRGGLFLTDRKGNIVDVDARLKKGDLFF